MSDCKYPHRVTIALTEEAFQKLYKELAVRYQMGDVSPTMADVILFNTIRKIEENDVHPIWLCASDVKGAEKTRKVRRTIVPCKECHEHPCTCELGGP